MNDREKVSDAIFTLEQSVLKTLLKEPLQPVRIAEILGIDAIPKRLDGRRTNTSNHVVTGILFALEQKEFVSQSHPYADWAITDLGRKHVQA